MVFRLKLARVAYLIAAFACSVQFQSSQCVADLLVGTAFDGGVLRINERTGAPLPGGVAAGSAGLSFTSGVTVGPDGNIYASSRGTGEVLFFDGDTGLPLPSPHAGGRAGLFATLASATTPESTPGPLRFGPDGNLYVSDFGSNPSTSTSSVWKFNGTTGDFVGFAGAAFAGPPAGLAFGSDGDLYVGDFGAASVLRIDNGTPSFFVTQQSGGLVTPSSLLFLPDGDLLVVDLFGNKILRYDENGQSPSQFALIPPVNPPTQENPFGSNFPSDIAVDADGNLVLAVLGYTNPPDNRGAVLRYDLNGNLLGAILGMRTPLGSIAWIASPNAVAGDYDGNGTVGASDYAKWRADFGKTVAKGGGADGNGNGIVDAADYVVWRNVASGASVGAVVVPEPNTIGILLFGASFVAARPMRKFAARARR